MHFSHREAYKVIHLLFTKLIILIPKALSKSPLRLVVKNEEKEQESLLDLLASSPEQVEFINISEYLYVLINIYVEGTLLGLEWCGAQLHMDLRELTVMS